MPKYDVYAYHWDPDEGCYIITKNGDRLLPCSGSEADARHIVELLRKDVEKTNGKM